jgi:hypothetical protein
MSFKAFFRDLEGNSISSTKSKRSQSALEYMMTYGWAILIIVIVAVILYSMGIFNPSSSITTTSIGFSPFTVSSTVCSPAGLSVAIIGGGLPDTAASATISKIYITSNTGTTALTKEYNLTPVAISPGKTATIIIPTVSCTSANVKYSLSAKLQYGYSTSAGPVITNTTGTISGTSSSEAIVKYVPLTITSSTATSSPFQQMVIVNMNNYNSYASSNLQNIEFTYPNGTIIPSWRENGTANTQTVVYWLKLGSFTTATVYMDFFSTSSNVLNPVNTGEAPQLTCSNPSDTASCSTYAEYDNGANVFNNYWNFAGTSLNTNTWTTANAGGTITVNNGLDISMSSNWGTYVISKATFSDNEIFGSYFKSDNINPSSDAGASLIYSTSSSLSGSQYAATQYGYSGSFTNFVNNYANGRFPWSSIGTTYSYPTDTFYLYMIGINSTGAFGNGWINNTPINIANSNQLETSGYIALQQTQQTGIFQYVFVGAYPSNGVMPSVSFGSVA